MGCFSCLIPGKNVFGAELHGCFSCFGMNEKGQLEKDTKISSRALMRTWSICAALLSKRKSRRLEKNTLVVSDGRNWKTAFLDKGAMAQWLAYGARVVIRQLRLFTNQH